MWEDFITESNYKNEIEALISVLLSNKKGQKTLRRFFSVYAEDELVCKALLVTLLLKRDNTKGYERKERISFYIGYTFHLYRTHFN